MCRQECGARTGRLAGRRGVAAYRGKLQERRGLGQGSESGLTVTLGYVHTPQGPKDKRNATTRLQGQEQSSGELLSLIGGGGVTGPGSRTRAGNALRIHSSRGPYARAEGELSYWTTC